MGKKKRLKAQRRTQRIDNTKRKGSLAKWAVIGTISVAALGYGAYHSYSNYFGASRTITAIDGSRETLAVNQTPSLEKKLTENPLQIARRDWTKRQNYLDALLERVDIPYCSEVVYDHDGSRILAYIRAELLSANTPTQEIEQRINAYTQEFKDGYYVAQVINIYNLSGTGRNTKIFVGRKMFEWAALSQDGDFKHAIVVHEARHCVQHGEGFNSIDKESLLNGVAKGLIEYRAAYEIGELDANYYGLKRVLSGEFKVSRGYFEKIRQHYMLNYIRLQSVLGKSSDIQRKFINAAFEKVKDLDFEKLENFTPLPSGS